MVSVQSLCTGTDCTRLCPSSVGRSLWKALRAAAERDQREKDGSRLHRLNVSEGVRDFPCGLLFSNVYIATPVIPKSLLFGILALRFARFQLALGQKAQLRKDSFESPIKKPVGQTRLPMQSKASESLKAVIKIHKG